MRRKEKYMANGAVIFGSVIALTDILAQWIEHMDRKEKFTWKSYDGMRTIRNGLSGGLVGAGFGYAAYEYRISEEKKLPFNSDEYLKKILSEENIKNNPSLFKAAKMFRDNIMHVLIDKLESKLAGLPEGTGSFYKKTAINSGYDLDIILPYKSSSYGTLEEMYYGTFEFLHQEFGDVAEITKHTRAIGVTFEFEEEEVHFDIVPGREINNYKVDKDLKLFVKPDWAWQRGGSFKTNVFDQKTITVNKPEARRIIKLLKAYKDRNGLPLPTVIVEQGVVEALDEKRCGVFSSDTKNLLNCMEYIAEKLEQKSFVDQANSNNNLNAKISGYQKSYLIDQLFADIERIEENPRYIKEIFE